MFAWGSLQITLRSRQGDWFVLSDEYHHFNYEKLIFKNRFETAAFMMDIEYSDRHKLEEELQDHPIVRAQRGFPVSVPIEDALVKGDFTIFVTHRDQTRNHKTIENLYGQIRLKLQQIIASEKAEAAAIQQKYQSLNKPDQVVAHANRVGKGLKDAGLAFLSWAKDIHEVSAGYKILGRMYDAARDAQYCGSVLDWLTQVDGQWRAAEYRGWVEALGFDPARIRADDFYEAWEMAQVVWNNERSQQLLIQFGKDYANAQHSLEVSELLGGAAFEILFTLVLSALTAGAGVAARLATQPRLVRQMTAVGDLFKELAQVQKEVYRHTPREQHRSRPKGSIYEDLPSEKAIITQPGKPPTEPTKKDESKQANKRDLNNSAVRSALFQQYGVEVDSYKALQKIKKEGYQREHFIPHSNFMTRSKQSGEARSHVPIGSEFGRYNEGDAITYFVYDDQSKGTEHRYLTDVEKGYASALQEKGEYATVTQWMDFMEKETALSLSMDKIERAPGVRAARIPEDDAADVAKAIRIEYENSLDKMGVNKNALMSNLVGGGDSPTGDDAKVIDDF